MEIIKLNEEQIKFIEPIMERNHDAQTAFQHASHNLKITNDEIWNVIRELFSDKKIIKGDLDWENKEIIIRE